MFGSDRSFAHSQHIWIGFQSWTAEQQTIPVLLKNWPQKAGWRPPPNAGTRGWSTSVSHALSYMQTDTELEHTRTGNWIRGIALILKKLGTALTILACVWVGQRLSQHRYITAQILWRCDSLAPAVQRVTGLWPEAQMVFHLQVAVAGGAGVVDLIWSDFKVVVRIKVADLAVQG